MTNETSTHPRIAKWELNALVVEALLFASICMGVLVGFGRRGRLGLQLPEYAWFGIGFTLLFVLLIPIQSVLARQKGVEIRLGRALLAAVIGAIVGAALTHLLG